MLNADMSSSAELLHIQPVYLDTQWADQLFLLLSEVVDGDRTLRLDSIQASNPLGTAINIARIKTETASAFSSAKFAEISLELESPTSRKHVFATLIY